MTSSRSTTSGKSATSWCRRRNWTVSRTTSSPSSLPSRSRTSGLTVNQVRTSSSSLACTTRKRSSPCASISMSSSAMSPHLPGRRSRNAVLAGSLDAVAEQQGPGGGPGDVEEVEPAQLLVLEEAPSPAGDRGGHHELQLVHQPRAQQRPGEGGAAVDADVPAVAVLQRGDALRGRALHRGAVCPRLRQRRRRE